MTRTVATDLSFETPRVKARLLCEDDLDLYLALYSDPEVMRHIGPVMGREEVEVLFRKAMGHNIHAEIRARYWALLHRRTGEKLGIVAIVRDAEHINRGELGLMLLPIAQKAGVGVQVLSALCEQVFRHGSFVGIEELSAQHSQSNPSAGRLVEFLGFTQHLIGTQGAVRWSMSAEEWLFHDVSDAARLQR